MTSSMTGRSSTRLELMPNSVELCGNCERRQRDGHAADQHQIEYIRTDDIADGQVAVALDQRR